MYIEKTDLTNQGITWSDAYLDSLIARAEAVFNTLIGDEKGIVSQERTEELEEVYSQKEFQLKYMNPTSLTTINGDSIDAANHKIIWQKLLLKDAVSSLTDFPFLCTIIYTAWYASDSIPEDVKQACLTIAWYFHNTKTSQWVSSFSQDLLQVSYWAKEEYDYLEKMGQSSIINKYKQYYAYSL
jgi:hypothetical protein